MAPAQFSFPPSDPGRALFQIYLAAFKGGRRDGETEGQRDNAFSLSLRLSVPLYQSLCLRGSVAINYEEMIPSICRIVPTRRRPGRGIEQLMANANI